ncbi:oligosaccharide flippase family protein [Marixanthomonas ophiurae]|uniref:Polysaccharide biosynthesis protein C-terminal domain-containing protein n=1 Tax=Marixanthomonas ophiurae TaxID=387659 RepID=A0A3E1QAK0_9FLAO|nr:oligosaccharide flippase family protein [Marixanthomonas ophiurae]RFN59165.1 hypothetical protein DZ858_03565 [Marixanthomonas ophiurae]
MLELINNKYKQYSHYLLYGSSIVFGRGLEYLWFFIISYYATKQQYGEFELYKKIIEFFAIFASLGFPALILTYTRTKQEKQDFFITGVFLSLCITIFAALILILFNANYLFLIVPILFFAIFHYSNSIYQAYNLVEKGSKYASYYKSLVSILFTVSILLFFFTIEEKEFSIIYCTYPLFIIGIIYLIKDFSIKAVITSFKKTKAILKSQFYNGSVLFLTTLVNTSFLVTDVFIINYYSGSSEGKLADYNFPLMIANMLLIVSMTLTNVDIEKYKQKHSYFKSSLRKNTLFTFLGAILLFIFYFLLTKFIYTEYENTLVVFIVILAAKVIQSLTIPYGVYLATKAVYTYVLIVLIVALLFNICFSFFLYPKYGLIGIAAVSLLGLLIRYLLYLKKYNHGRNIWRID